MRAGCWTLVPQRNWVGAESQQQSGKQAGGCQQTHSAEISNERHANKTYVSERRAEADFARERRCRDTQSATHGSAKRQTISRGWQQYNAEPNAQHQPLFRRGMIRKRTTSASGQWRMNPSDRERTGFAHQRFDQLADRLFAQHTNKHNSLAGEMTPTSSGHHATCKCVASDPTIKRRESAPCAKGWRAG